MDEGDAVGFAGEGRAEEVGDEGAYCTEAEDMDVHWEEVKFTCGGVGAWSSNVQ